MDIPTVFRLVAAVDRLASFVEDAAHGLGGISFVLFSGDAVKHGQTYACWREWDRCRAAAEYMFAAIPGNKEYYRDEGKRRWHDGWTSRFRAILIRMFVRGTFAAGSSVRTAQCTWSVRR